jgi:uncharacterized protein (TIGR02001 family)
MPAPLRRYPLLAALSIACLVSLPAIAQTPPAPATPAAPAPEPDWTFTSNIGLYSQYVFRGVSQTNEKPAVQGGFDLGHKSGFYVGTWASNISWISDADPRASASMEWDFYGGYKGSLPADFSYDIGGLYYYYPGSYPAHYVKPDTFEFYGALSWKFLTLKYSYSTGDTFGFANARGSDYIDLTASYDVVEKVNDTIGKVTLIGHVGRQRFKNSGAYDYTDWKAGVATEAWGVAFGIYVTDTNASEALYTNAYGKKIASTQVVGYVQKTF